MAGPSFVGGVAGGVGAAGANIPLNSLTGGSASAAAVGDVVVIAVCVKTSSDISITMSTAGYTALTELYANATYDTNLAVFAKKLSSAETSAVVTWGAAYPASVAVSVWRDVDDIIFDVASVSAIFTNTGTPNAAAIATATADAVVLAIGACVGDESGSAAVDALTVPSGMGNFVGFRRVSTTGSGTVGTAAIGIAAIARPTPGSYDPPVFGGGDNDASQSAAAYTIALRPLVSAVPVSGPLPSMTVTAPTASVAGKAAVSAALPGITCAPPAGSATGRAVVSAALPGISYSPPAAVVGGATLVSVELPGFSISAPAATVQAGAVFSADLPGIALSPPAAAVGISPHVIADLPGMSFSAPEGLVTIPVVTPASRIITFPANLAADRTISFALNRADDRIVNFA